MWTLRRLSNALKGLSGGISRACYSRSEILSGYGDFKVSDIISVFPQLEFVKCQMAYTDDVFSKFSFGRRAISSQAGKESSESKSEEDGFTQLEAPATADPDLTMDVGEVISEPELSGDENIDEPSQNELELSKTESEAGRRKKPAKEGLKLFKAIMDAPGLSVQTALDKWVEEGKYLGRGVIAIAMLNLRKCQMYGRALQFSEWLESNKHLEFAKRDYASRLDLIVKVHGIQKAESYITKIPQSCREGLISRTVLANYVSGSNVTKVEEVFNKMKDIGLTITSSSCNRLLLFYKRVNKKKIADVLLLMEKENIKPTLSTYIILIDTKGLANDIDGMDRIVEIMKAQGIEPSVRIKAILVKHYVSGGFKEKAEALLKEMEGGNLNKHRWGCRVLLPLYAALGKVDEVGRVWKVFDFESNPKFDDCLAIIEAWGRLKKIDEAEAILERMSKVWKKLSSRQYSSLLKVCANNEMLSKGKDLIKRMADSGGHNDPFAWDALLKIYVEAGEVEKADSILQKATIQQNQIKLKISSYMAVMNHYAKSGDIHNAEKMFHMIRQAGYVSRVMMFNALMQAYINAKAPAYGMKDRMRADNVFPNEGLAGQLELVDAFRKTPASGLLH